ncbi:MAG: protein kinase [Desulfurococcales archaeon ex4484_217_2]|nr:MAG: protein kinase [Desulfurococcales archaeon ex4484_217_2]
MVRFKIRKGFGKKSSLAEKLSKLLRRRGKKRVEEIIKGIIKREPITILPLKPTYTIIETYYVYEPFAKVNIVSIPEKGGMLGYYVEEFTLTRDEQEILEKLIDILTEELEPVESIEDLKSYVAREVIRLANKYRSVFKLTGSRRAKILYYVERNLLHKKYESLPTNIIFNTTDHLNDFIMRLAHMAGKHVSIAFPILDAMLPEKHRLAATFGTEVSPRGPTFTIRKFREKPLSPTELIKSGVINELFAAYIWYMVEKRRTFMIAGGTGAGKTTLLNAFSLFIRPGMKIVTVEDTPELNLPHENWVQLSTRVSYALMGQTSGEITLYDLIKVSLRYRPDYIIVGEVRGEEAFVLFQAMATGHGGLSTIHAETLDYAIKRLTSPPMNIPPTYMKLMNIFMHIKRVVKPKTPTRLKVERKVTIAQEVADYNDFRTVMKWDPVKDVHEVYFDNSILLRELAEQASITVDDVLEDIHKRAVFLKWLIARNIFDVWEVARYIFKYSFDPSNMYKMALEDLKSLGVDVEALIKI